MLHWLSFFAGSLSLTPGGGGPGLGEAAPCSKIVTELINFDDFASVNLAVLRRADVHRPDLVAHLWPQATSCP
jgi:hypothetical protein